MNKYLKYSLLSIALLGFMLALVIAVTNYTNTHTFIWDWPVSFHKMLRIEDKVFLDPELEVLENPEDNSIVLRVSHYNPDLGGVNCANFVDGECISNMANAEKWQENIGIAIACPKELEFGTKIKINGRVWECMDRGSRINKDGEVYWIDMLTPYPLYDYGEIVVGEKL